MSDWLVGLFLVAIGLLFCFRGYLAMRLIIPLWGATAGFFLGAGLIASFGGDGFLSTALGWAVGMVVAMVFGLLAYLYYEVSVFIAMGAIGFVLGTTIMTALGVSWNWLVILVGLAVAVLLALFAILYDMPMALLTILTATAGASTAIAGLFLILGKLDLADLEDTATVESIAIEWWWYAIYGALVVAGIVAQVTATGRLQASLKEQWEASGGKTFRAT